MTNTIPLTIWLVLSTPLQSLDVVEIARTTGNPSAPFGTIGSMLEVARGSVVLADDVHPALHKWNVDSNEVGLFARDGRGPGEVLTPAALARRPSGGFALYDVGHGGVLLFDQDLRFERRVVLKGGMISNSKGMAVLADDSFIVAGGRLRDPRHLHRYDSAGEWLQSFGASPIGLLSTMTKVQTAGGALRGHGRDVIFSFGAPLRIVRLQGGGFDRVQLISEDLELLPELTEAAVLGPPNPELGGARPFLWWHDRSTGVFVLPGDRILNVVKRYYRGDSVWDLYSRSGQRLARTIVPRAYHAWDMTRDGHVLASYRDGQTDEHIAAVLRIVVR